MRRITVVALILCLQLAPARSVQSAGETDLFGTWDDVTPEQERERVGYGDHAPRPRVCLTFDGSACTWQVRGGPTIRQSLFITVPAGQDRGIDFVTVSSRAFWKSRALFRIDADTLTIKEGAIDRPRPSDWSPVEFDGQNADTLALIHVYKRRFK
jgi:hypothetical protein